MFSLSVNRSAYRVLLVAGVLLAGSILVMTMLRPTFAQDSGAIEYAEKGTDPVATYTAVDPEGAAIAWSLSGADAAGFTIAGGVLAFVKEPNFEAPADAAPADNIYVIMVEATDGTGHVGRETVMVEVTNVDEDGTVELSALQPAPGVAFTATLTDIDNGTTDLTDSAEWQWSRSESESGGWADIDKATSSAYTPDLDGADSGYYLRATAKYKDKQSPSGADNDKTASVVSANMVLVLRASNKAPEFAAVQDPDGVDAEAMAIAKRTVTETAAAGQLVGVPVTAEDGDAADVLTYTLEDASGNFVIDRATGQISVAKGAKFSVAADDVHPEDVTVGADSYPVTVIATDPKGIPTKVVAEAIEDFSDTVEVTINVTAVDEPPIFTAVENTSVSFIELTDIDTELATFMATDPEDDDAPTLGIRGADSSKFTFVPGTGVLTFKDAPNFEKPADADKDNVYEVTITATDGNANMATRDVKVTVTNAEEAGKVTLSQPRPRAGLTITASYSDPDGGLASATWQWWRTVDNNLGATAPALTQEGIEELDTDTTTWEMIAGATSASYTPVDDEADETKSDVGRYLLAVVSYTDAKRNVASDGEFDEDARDRAGLVSVNPVARDTRNRAPVFGDEDSDTPGTQNQTAMREVEENTEDTVGKAVTAKDPDPNEDPLIYALSGADAALFSVDDDDAATEDVDEGGQIKVKSGTKLDFETKTTYMVTITATDSFSDSASIDVTITVTDADEAPDVTGDAAIEYAENGTGSVATYTADDPEGAAVKWSLSGADDSLFSIEGGVLAFVKSPNFEDAKDAGGGDNIYDVMVEATDGTGHVGRKAVEVEVTNVDEDGTVELSALQPAPSVAFTATLADLDNPAADTDINGLADLTGSASWQWSRSTRASGGWADIDKATSSMYRPEEDGGDSGYYLRATAKYKDKQSPSGAGNDKTAFMVSANKVLTLRTTNKVPKFAEPVVNEGTYLRTVAETAEAGQLVGDPVTAEDGNAADVLTYTLEDASGNFVIDRATGQISVAKGAKFDVTTDDDIAGVVQMAQYTVMVIATDPKGIPTKVVAEAIEDFSDTVEVTINVTAVDEPPIFTAVENTSVSFIELTDIDTELATFMATDPEDDDAPTLGIRGADSSKFTFVPGTGVLTFKDAPNFEKPADADKDNVYEVTITATDGNANMATRDVKVTVTNAEEAGKVTLSQTRPRAGLTITASYSDPDGGLASATWQWWRTVDNNLGATAPALTQEGIEELDTDTTTWEMIAGATSASYTPVDDEADETKSDVGRYPLAVVSYTDAKRNVASDGEFDEDARDRAGLVSVNPVARDTRNRAPVFGDEDSDTPGTQNQTAMREVEENTEDTVGKAVTAKDPDPNEDPLVYRLSGADAALFSVDDDDAATEDVDEGGQIKVKSTTKLDFETRTTYMVTITATDSFSDSASIDVTIMVTDVDEEPKISEGGLAITGPASGSYAEDRRGAVATYSATGPESAKASWDLSGDDAGAFSISSSGELTFVSAPDYENAADADGDNEYLVTVEADDGTYTATKAVTVMVTNVNENGMVTLSSQTPVVGIALTASLTDADGEITGMKWQWASENTDGTFADIAGAGATSDSYTPADADVGKRLRATASYTDGHGSGKREMAESANAVSTTPTTVADSYDADGSGTIDRAEVGQAVRDFIGRQIEHDDVVKVIAQYFKDLRSGS